jgi:hypothetical protein
MERSLFRLSSMAVYVGLLFAPGVRSELATSAAYQTNAMDPESLVAAYHAAASKIFSFDLVMNTKSHAIIVVDRNGKSKLNTADQAENNKTSYRVLERPVVRSFVSKQVYKRGKFRTDLLEVDNAIKERDKILAAWNGVEAKAINRVAHSGIVSDFPNSNPGTFGFAYRQLYAYLRGSRKRSKYPSLPGLVACEADQFVPSQDPTQWQVSRAPSASHSGVIASAASQAAG